MIHYDKKWIYKFCERCGKTFKKPRGSSKAKLCIKCWELIFKNRKPYPSKQSKKNQERFREIKSRVLKKHE